MKKMAIHDVHDVGKQTTLINFNNHWKPGLQADFSGYSTQPILQRSRVVKYLALYSPWKQDTVKVLTCSLMENSTTMLVHEQ